VDLAVAQTVRAFEDYHRQALETFKLQGKELRDLVSSMAEAVAFMATETEISMKQLGLGSSQIATRHPNSRSARDENLRSGVTMADLHGKQTNAV
jgi:hypothetical protein